MGIDNRDHALGGLVLGIAVLCIVLAPLREHGGIDTKSLTRPDDPVTAAALGWPVLSTCGDPAVWRSLPAIGATRGQRLAEAASRGAFQGQGDLLQVPGIGIKMAALLAPRVSWIGSHPGACQPAEEPR